MHLTSTHSSGMSSNRPYTLSTRLMQALHRSYQVPKEVGKVGSESPTFVQPIAERKDGIHALFAKQSLLKSSDLSHNNHRKRDASPIPPDTDAIMPSAKKAKSEMVDAWEDDSDIEYIDGPSMPSKDKKERSNLNVFTSGYTSKSAAHAHCGQLASFLVNTVTFASYCRYGRKLSVKVIRP